jgi:hypothetical protein
MPYADPERRKAYDRARNVTEARRAYMRAWTPKGKQERLGHRGREGRRGWIAEPKISDRAVACIRAAVADGESVADLSRAWGISYGYTWALARGLRRGTSKVGATYSPGER